MLTSLTPKIEMSEAFPGHWNNQKINVYTFCSIFQSIWELAFQSIWFRPLAPSVLQWLSFPFHFSHPLLGPHPKPWWSPYSLTFCPSSSQSVIPTALVWPIIETFSPLTTLLSTNQCVLPSFPCLDCLIITSTTLLPISSMTSFLQVRRSSLKTPPIVHSNFSHCPWLTFSIYFFF